jgi:hypothetical protein
MKLRIVLISFATLLAIFAISCKSSKKVAKWQVAPNEYAFVEYFQVNDGKVLEGDVEPGRRIDGPTYSFNPESKEVMSYLSQSFNKDSLFLLLGRGLVLRGTQGGGMHSRLVEINSFPYVDGKLTIKSLNESGLTIKWDGETFSINPGDVWERTITKTDSVDSYNGKAVVEIISTYTIKFHGFLQKEKLSLK